VSPSSLSNASKFRRTMAGGGLIAAPLLLLLGDVLGTRGPTNIRDFLAEVADEEWQSPPERSPAVAESLSTQ
jgi:hypothetical protein